jgi:hypothetical protein
MSEARRARQICAVGGEVDPGQHDFAVAGDNQAACLLGNEAHRDRSAGAASIGDHAEGAAMIAALLDLQEGAAPALEAVDEVSGGFGQFGRFGRARDIAERAQLGLVVEHRIDLGQSGVTLGCDCRSAAGHDDPRFRAAAAGAPDGLAGLPLSLRRNGTGVDYHRAGEAGAFSRAANDLGFEDIEAAAEGDDLVVRHVAQPAASRSGSNTPSKLRAAGPVMTM